VTMLTIKVAFGNGFPSRFTVICAFPEDGSGVKDQLYGVTSAHSAEAVWAHARQSAAMSKGFIGGARSSF
jgi:hypothetical protein